jgi:hypothetical protein
VPVLAHPLQNGTPSLAIACPALRGRTCPSSTVPHSLPCVTPRTWRLPALLLLPCTTPRGPSCPLRPCVSAGPCRCPLGLADPNPQAFIIISRLRECCCFPSAFCRPSKPPEGPDRKSDRLPSKEAWRPDQESDLTCRAASPGANVYQSGPAGSVGCSSSLAGGLGQYGIRRRYENRSQCASEVSSVADGIRDEIGGIQRAFHFRKRLPHVPKALYFEISVSMCSHIKEPVP